MNDNTGVWIRILVPEELHANLKITAIQERLPNGKHKTIQDKVIECIKVGLEKEHLKKGKK